MKQVILGLFILISFPGIAQEETSSRNAGLAVRFNYQALSSLAIEDQLFDYSAYFHSINSKGRIIGIQLGLPNLDKGMENYSRTIHFTQFAEAYYLFPLFNRRFHLGPGLLVNYNLYKSNPYTTQYFASSISTSTAALCIRPSKDFNIGNTVLNISFPIKIIAFTNSILKTNNPNFIPNGSNTSNFMVHKEPLSSNTPVIALGITF